MVDDINCKQLAWNSSGVTPNGERLHRFAQSRLAIGPAEPTFSSATRGVAADILIVQELLVRSRSCLYRSSFLNRSLR